MFQVTLKGEHVATTSMFVIFYVSTINISVKYTWETEVNVLSLFRSK